MPTDLHELSEDKLWQDVLEKESYDRDLNASYVIRKYRETCQERSLLRLIQDIHQRIGIYSNILKEIKRQIIESGRMPGVAGASPTAAQLLKEKYEGLGLVPEGQLPNPFMSETADFVLNKLRRFGTLLLDLMATQAEAISTELRVSPDVTVTFQVELDLTPSLSIGVEREGRMVRP